MGTENWRTESHTKVIDSGEADIDTNRHIFDSLVPYKEAIYGVLGKKA